MFTRINKIIKNKVFVILSLLIVYVILVYNLKLEKGYSVKRNYEKNGVAKIVSKYSNSIMPYKTIVVFVTYDSEIFQIENSVLYNDVEYDIGTIVVYRYIEFYTVYYIDGNNDGIYEAERREIDDFNLIIEKIKDNEVDI